MKLEELIEKLEEAQGQPTEGELTVVNRKLFDEPTSSFELHRLLPDTYDIVADDMDEEVAQAIATRHNTAGAVLEKLQDLRLLIECSRDEILHLRSRAETAEERASYLGPALARVARLCEELRTRSTKSEEESARLKTALIATGV